MITPGPDNTKTDSPVSGTVRLSADDPGFTGPRTIIIPTGQQESAAVPQPQNPFMPAMPATPSGNSRPPHTGSGGVFMRLLFLMMFLVFLGTGYVLYNRFSGGASALPEPEEVTLNYWGFWENDTHLRSVISQFEEAHPGIRVQYTQQSPRQYRERVQSAINRGEGPDIFRFHNTWVVMMRNQLATVPATVMTAQDFSSTFYPVAVADLIAGTTIYGIPLMIDGLGLYINEDLFTAAGVTTPATWTDLMNIVPKLTVKNGPTILTSAIALGTAANIDYFSDILGVMFMQNGASPANLEGKQAEGTLVFYRKFSDPSDPMYSWNDAMDNSTTAFAGSKVAMIIAPSSAAAQIKKSNPALRFRVVPLPQLVGNTVTWAAYWVEGVSRRSPYQKQAWEFVRFLTGKEGAASMYDAQVKARGVGEPPARLDLAPIAAADPIAATYVGQAGSARSFPVAYGTYDNGINDKLSASLASAVSAINSGTAPAKALGDLSAQFRQVLAFYGLVSSVPVTGQ